MNFIDSILDAPLSRTFSDGHFQIKEVVAKWATPRYTPVSTNELCAALEHRGFYFRSSSGGYNTKKGHTTKHVVRMAFAEKIQFGEDMMCPEVVITNSFDCMSSLKVDVGIFRLVCTNGLTVKVKDFGSLKLRHVGNADDMAHEILMGMIDLIPEVENIIIRMRCKVLTEQQAIDFAIKAAQIRWNKEFTPEQAKVLLKAARPEDDGLHLWEVMNRVQENALSVSGLQIPGMRRSRLVTNPGNYEKINAGIFEIAVEQMN